jgi:hypothetical protein
MFSGGKQAFKAVCSIKLPAKGLVARKTKGEGYGKQENGGRTGRFAVQRVQKAELYYQKEPAEHPGKAGNEQVLSF